MIGTRSSTGRIVLPLLACSLLLAAPVRSAEPSGKTSIDPVLPPNADVLAKLKALGENSGCLIGDPKVVARLGDLAKRSGSIKRMKKDGPGVRDYSIKMAWMPDRKRAFFCGANHAVPHRLNDAWEYDLAANTWALLYAPD